MIMSRRSRKRKKSLSDSLFEKWGSKDNFFTLSGSAARAFGGNGKSKRQGQSASINISGAGSLDRDAPQIAGGGRASRKVPDIGGRRRDRRKRSVPDVGGAGQVASRDVPSIGGGGLSERGIPSLGGRAKGKKERIPGVSGAGKASRDAPSLGEDPYKGKKQPPDISGRVGPWQGRRRERAAGVVGSIAAQVGRFRPLSDKEEAEYSLFVRRAHQAGYEVGPWQTSSWRADLMLQKYDAEDLWRNDIGQEIQRRYGTKGADLDLPPEDRPKRGFVREREEPKDEGVAGYAKRFNKTVKRLRSIFRR
jgi:hypothetical protein